MTTPNDGGPAFPHGLGCYAAGVAALAEEMDGQ